jgi:hypothetical protein
MFQGIAAFGNQHSYQSLLIEQLMVLVVLGELN